MINTIIVFGANGMLGRYIKQYFSKLGQFRVIGVTRANFEITRENIPKLNDYLLSMHIDESTCIINCAGQIPQRTPSDYYTVNTLFPLALARISKKYGGKLIHPSTDCVYSGIGKGGYIETDYHDEISEYGISKSLGEPPSATVIRCSIIGEELENKKSFLEWVKSSKGIINGWDNHIWNGITCLEYCKVINNIINNSLFWIGVRHIYSPEPKSKYEMACIIRDVYELNIDINKVSDKVQINKTLQSIYSPLLTIKPLEEQIKELATYNFL